jgi:lipoate-protein ligase A
MNGIFRGEIMGQSTYKVPGGKMLKIQLSVSGEKIKHVTIMGDFFLHPEETILNLEDKLKGLKLDRDILINTIHSVLAANDALLIGAKPKDIVEAILMAT